MEYRGYNITSDNTFYKNGQHAVRTQKGRYVCWHDTFTHAILFVRSFT